MTGAATSAAAASAEEGSRCPAGEGIPATRAADDIRFPRSPRASSPTNTTPAETHCDISLDILGHQGAPPRARRPRERAFDRRVAACISSSSTGGPEVERRLT